MQLLGHVSATMSLRYGRLFDATVRDRVRTRPHPGQGRPRPAPLAGAHAPPPAGARCAAALVTSPAVRDWHDSPTIKSRLAGGFCLRAPAQGSCAYANICEHCPNFRTDAGFLAVLGAQRADAAALAADADTRGWADEAARHRRLADRLDQLITHTGTRPTPPRHDPRPDPDPRPTPPESARPAKPWLAAGATSPSPPSPSTAASAAPPAIAAATYERSSTPTVPPRRAAHPHRARRPRRQPHPGPRRRRRESPPTRRRNPHTQTPHRGPAAAEPEPRLAGESTNTMSTSRFSRCATEAKISAAISSSASSRKSIARRRRRRRIRRSRRSRPARPTQRVAASLLPGSSARWATSANSTRSTASAVQASPGRDPAQRGADAEPLPQPVQHPRPTEASRVQHLDLAGLRGRDRLLRVEEPRDRGHQPGQRVAVHGLGAAEAVDHLRRGHPGDRMAFAVRQLQIRHRRTVAVAPLRLPQVHAYTTSTYPLLKSSDTPQLVCLHEFAVR